MERYSEKELPEVNRRLLVTHTLFNQKTKYESISKLTEIMGQSCSRIGVLNNTI